MLSVGFTLRSEDYIYPIVEFINTHRVIYYTLSELITELQASVIKFTLMQVLFLHWPVRIIYTPF